MTWFVKSFVGAEVRSSFITMTVRDKLGDMEHFDVSFR